MKQIKILFIAIIFFSFSSSAQPGFLDASFGDSGIVFTELQGSINTAILQNNGTIVAGGNGESFVLASFLADGTLNDGFGDQGLVKNIFTEYTSQEVNKIVALPEGKFITVAQGVKSALYIVDILVARYNSDGTPDITFGINGKIVLDFGYNEFPTEMALQSDGKFVIRGNMLTNIDQNTVNVFVTRIFPDGSLDESFGNKGLSTWNGNVSTLSKGLALQSDGKIVVSVKRASSVYYFGLLRYNNDGSFDSSFGNNGYLKTDLSNSENEFLNAVVIQEDGKIVATGQSKSNFVVGDMTVIRYNNNGTIDESFGSKGVTSVKFDSKNASEGLTLAVQSNGKIIVGGSNYNLLTNPPKSDFALLRLNIDGTLDSSFGIEGRQLTNIGLYDAIISIIIQRDGKIMAFGQSVDLANFFVYARYLGDPTNPRPTIAQIKRWIRNHILHFEDANTKTAYYVIEKSTATNTAFVPVTKITANAATNNYSYTLPETTTQSTYRIKAVNKDNSITYSTPIISSDPAIAGVASFTIYPNPAKDRITVETAGTVQLRLQNSNGRVLLTQTITGKGSIDINKLPNGIYYVVNTTNGESLKVVKE